MQERSSSSACLLPSHTRLQGPAGTLAHGTVAGEGKDHKGCLLSERVFLTEDVSDVKYMLHTQGLKTPISPPNPNLHNNSIAYKSL